MASLFQCDDTLFTKSYQEHGWDTVQYTEEGFGAGNASMRGTYNTFMFIQTGPGVQGKYPCATDLTQSGSLWRSGWAASSDCFCQNSIECQNCGTKRYKGVELAQI